MRKMSLSLDSLPSSSLRHQDFSFFTLKLSTWWNKNNNKLYIACAWAVRSNSCDNAPISPTHFTCSGTHIVSVCNLSAHVTAAPPQIWGLWVHYVWHLGGSLSLPCFCCPASSVFISSLVRSTEFESDDKIAISATLDSREESFICDKLAFVAVGESLYAVITLSLSFFVLLLVFEK